MFAFSLRNFGSQGAFVRKIDTKNHTNRAMAQQELEMPEAEEKTHSSTGGWENLWRNVLAHPRIPTISDPTLESIGRPSANCNCNSTANCRRRRARLTRTTGTGNPTATGSCRVGSLISPSDRGGTRDAYKTFALQYKPSLGTKLARGRIAQRHSGTTCGPGRRLIDCNCARRSSIVIRQFLAPQCQVDPTMMGY